MRVLDFVDNVDVEGVNVTGKDTINGKKQLASGTLVLYLHCS